MLGNNEFILLWTQMACCSTNVPSIFQCKYLSKVSTSRSKGHSRAIISTCSNARGPQGTRSLVIYVSPCLIALSLTLRLFFRMAGSFILNVVYGIEARSTDDHFVRMAEASMQVVSEAANPGSFLVDTLPICTFFGLSDVLCC
jgi:hypothetical protein